MECVSETRLLALLRGQRLRGLQIEIVVKVQVLELFAVYEQVEHIVSLTTDLQSRLNPVQFGALEKLGGFQALEQIVFRLGFVGLRVQLIQDPRLQ